MAKEKRRIDKVEEKIYFYEISATIVILFSLITFSELGFVGRGLKSLMKIMFGDFYFIIIIYLIGNGIYALVKRRWFDFTSIKFNGFILFFIALISLNHIGFYERMGFASTEIFSNTMTTYLNTMKNLIQINSYGGGVIGALFLQVLIFLFNTLGTMIILIVLLVLSISFMTSLSYKTCLYYTNVVFKKIRTYFIGCYKYFHNIKFPNKTIKKAKLNLNLNLNLLNDCDNQANEAIAYKMSVEIKNNLTHYLNNIGSIVKDVKMEVSFSVTRFTYSLSKMMYQIEGIRKITDSHTIVYEKNNLLIIEVTNKVKKLLTIKHLLLNTKEIPLGIELNNQMINFNPIEHKNMLLTGSNNVGIKTYLKCFIVSNIFKYKYDFKLVLFDYAQSFIELKYMPNLFIPYSSNKSDLINNLDTIAKELERRIALINDLGYVNYIEHNKLEESKIEVIYVVLNNIDVVKNDVEKQESKLLYFIKFGYKVGIHFLIINRNIGIDKELLVNIQTKLIFKCNLSAQSYEILNNNNGCLLEEKADILINMSALTLRASAPYISSNDYDKIISKFICN